MKYFIVFLMFLVTVFMAYNFYGNHQDIKQGASINSVFLGSMMEYLVGALAYFFLSKFYSSIAHEHKEPKVDTNDDNG